MSFILDALRKSEHERQRQEGPAIADLRVAPPPRPRFPVWAIALAALLAVNLAVILVLVVRGNAPRPAPAPQAVAAIPAPQTQGPVDLVAEPVLPSPLQPRFAPSAAPAAEPAFPDTPLSEDIEPRLQQPLQTPLVSEPAPEDEGLPLASEVVLPGGESLPAQRLDIHVYAQRPADRFVFINMRKYREGEQTVEGMQVRRITDAGVVLEYRGTRFLMPRQ